MVAAQYRFDFAGDETVANGSELRAILRAVDKRLAVVPVQTHQHIVESVGALSLEAVRIPL
jgi:hypothetical protein